MRNLLLLLVVISLGVCGLGCASTQASVTKEEEARFRDRNPADIHAPPAGAVPSGPPAGVPKASGQ